MDSDELWRETRERNVTTSSFPLYSGMTVGSGAYRISRPCRNLTSPRRLNVSNQMLTTGRLRYIQCPVFIDNNGHDLRMEHWPLLGGERRIRLFPERLWSYARWTFLWLTYVFLLWIPHHHRSSTSAARLWVQMEKIRGFSLVTSSTYTTAFQTR